ncbi:MAG: hypothetical protein KDN19_05630 [Verrucomicrobiae bacterium]|nr:hypothetical protein [Verrucomicrobiae bacterium]
MAIDIDFNPVRAGMLKDPKDDPWCAHGVNRKITWAKTAPKYRLWLYGKGQEKEAAKSFVHFTFPRD